MTKKRQHPHAHLLRLNQSSAAGSASTAAWPGAADPSLARPDLVKFDYGASVISQEPGRTKLAQMTGALRLGPLEFFGEAQLKDYGLEEFLWHGAPGDDWHPLESYLAANSQRFPPAAQAQLRHWKEARIGMYEIGEVAEGTVGLQEWDPLTGQHAGEPLRAIALNIGGAGFFRSQRGQVYLTYVSPWSPEAGIHCALGYGNKFKKRQAATEVALLMLGLRQPALVSQPYPWLTGPAAEAEALRLWRAREWHGWLAERLTFPFQAFVSQPPRGEQSIETVTQLVPATAEQARMLGIYLLVEKRSGKEALVSGLTGVVPTDLASPNWRPIAEYHAYRERVGPPPGTAGQPTFARIR